MLEQTLSTIHVLLSRHETVNERLKNLSVVFGVFWRNIHLHGFVFHNITEQTYIIIEKSDALFKLARKTNFWIFL